MPLVTRTISLVPNFLAKFKYFNNPDLAGDPVFMRNDLSVYLRQKSELFNQIDPDKNPLAHLRFEPKYLRAVCDHIAGMTDNYAQIEFYRLRDRIKSIDGQGSILMDKDILSPSPLNK